MRRVALALAAVVLAVMGLASLGDEKRDRALQPQRVLDAVGIRPGMTVADVGAGAGYWTLKLAARVGPTGRVVANDIDEDRLAELRDRAADRDLDNITTVLGEVDDPLLPAATFDAVFMVYALHDFTLPAEMLDSLAPSLRPDGVVVVLDRDPERSGDDHFLTHTRILELFAAAGYRHDQCEGFLEEDLLCVFRLAG